MIGQIGPLVQGASTKHRPVPLLHVLGGGLSGFGIGAVLALANAILASILGPAWPTAGQSLLITAALLAGAVDLGILPGGLMTWQSRQTPKGWLCALGPEGAAFAWGADLALAVTTRISYQAILIVPMAALTAIRWPIALFVMVVFGITRAALTSLCGLSQHYEDRIAKIDRLYERFRVIAGIASFGLAALTSAELFGLWR